MNITIIMCKFCNKVSKEKTNNYNDKWRSEIVIRDFKTKKELSILSICPKCRDNHKINELYTL